MCCVGGEVMPLFAQIKVRFYQGRPPENLNYRHKGRTKKNYRTMTYVLVLHGNRSETGCDTTHLSYKVLMVSYYMPSLHIA